MSASTQQAQVPKEGKKGRKEKGQRPPKPPAGDRPPKAPAVKKAPRPSFMQEEALLALLQKHQWIAGTLLVRQDPGPFHPLAMEAQCQLRVPALADTFQKTEAFLLEEPGRKAWALKVVQEWEDQHKDDLPASKVKTVADVVGGGENSADFTKLMEMVKEAVNAGQDVDLFEHAGLAYTCTVSATRFYEEGGSNFWYLDGSIYSAVPEGAEQKESARVSHIGRIRKGLATLGRDYLFNELLKLTSSEYQAAYKKGLPSGPTRWYTFIDQVAEAYRTMQAHVDKDQEEIPLVAIFPQMLAIFLTEYAKGRGFTTLIRRKLMRKLPKTQSVEEREREWEQSRMPNYGEDDEEEDDEEEDDDEDEGGEQPDEADFEFNDPDRRTIRWNWKDGRAVAVDGSKNNPKLPSLWFDLFSYVDVESKGTGLDAVDDDAYFKALTSKDVGIIDLLMPIIAAHPAFTGHATDGKALAARHAEMYQTISGADPASFSHTRERIEGFSLEPGKCELSLNNFWLMCCAEAVSRDLVNGEEFVRRGGQANCYERRRTPTVLMIKHIKTGTFDISKRQEEELDEAHEDDLWFGNYIGRLGDIGLSCKTRALADFLNATGSSLNKKLYAAKMYLRFYPDHHKFLPKELVPEGYDPEVGPDGEDAY